MRRVRDEHQLRRRIYVQSFASSKSCCLGASYNWLLKKCKTNKNILLNNSSEKRLFSLYYFMCQVLYHILYSDVKCQFKGNKKNKKSTPPKNQQPNRTKKTSKTNQMKKHQQKQRGESEKHIYIFQGMRKRKESCQSDDYIKIKFKKEKSLNFSHL